jgi:mono/diheme cytochrome c family protein
MNMVTRLAGAAVVLAVALAGAPTVAAQADADWSAYRKQVQEAPRDTIEANAYSGWKQYELNCARCHGEYGVGTSFAPALVASLKDQGTIPDQAAFVSVVCQGRKEKGMPSWCELGLEMDKIMNMYAYLKLRADGKVHAGRPASKG